MLSTPVCGVDSMNAVVAPRLAPCRLSEAATGNTPQEHRGSGTPKRLALKTWPRPRPPRWCSTHSGEMKTESTPATKKPNSRYGAISASTDHDATRISRAMFMTVPYLLNV